MTDDDIRELIREGRRRRRQERVWSVSVHLLAFAVIAYAVIKYAGPFLAPFGGLR